MACVVLVAFVAILVGCDKNEGKSEVAMSVYELTDSTAMLKCDYSPAKSVTYDLQIGETVTKKYATSVIFKISNMNSGTTYSIVAISFDAENKEVGTTVFKFMTTGEPNNRNRRPIVEPDSQT